MTRRAFWAVIVTALLGLLVGFPLTRAGAQPTTTTVAPTTEAPTTEAPTTPAPTTAPPTTPPTTTPVTTTPATSAPTTSTSTSTTSTSVPATQSSSSNTTAIVVGILIAVAVALLILLIVFLVRRRRRADWWTRARLVAAEASALASAVDRGVPLLRDPGAAAQVWADLNTRIAHLRGELRTLGQSAPDGPARTAANRASQGAETLQSAIDTDRAVRIGPPPPTPEQLGYSEALLRQRAAELERLAQDFEVTAPPP
jgi:hypothetical protein